MGKSLTGIEVAEKIDKYTKGLVESLEGVKPTLAILEASNNKGIQSYKNSIIKKASSLGIEVLDYKWEKENIALEEVVSIINDLNNDDSIHSVFPLKPFDFLFENQQILWNLIDKEKDVDKVSNEALGSIITTKISSAPCTVEACFAILDHYNIYCEGKRILVIGRSTDVGKPAALMALNKDATVIIAHSKTKNLQSLIDESEIIICAVGKPNFITKDMLNSNHIVIDVGINVVNGKIIGDVEDESIEVVRAMTPVPGGVGSVTTSILMLKTALAAKRAIKN